MTYTFRQLWRHGFLWPIRDTLKSLRVLAIDLPRYLRDEQDYRRHTKPTTPYLIFGRRLWTSRYRINLPVFHVSVSDGMGEHYGYPRHTCYLILWLGRHGYAFGIYFSPPLDS